MKAFADPLRRDRRDDLDQRQGRGHRPLSGGGAGRRRGVGGVLPHRPAVEAPAPLPRHLGLDDGARRRRGMAARRVLQRRRRRRRDGDADPRPDSQRLRSRSAWWNDSGVVGPGRVGRGTHPAAPAGVARGAAAAGDRLDSRAGTLGALHALQAAHRRAAPRRVADAGGAGAGAGGHAAGDVRRRAAHGRVDAVGGVVRRAGVARRHRRGPLAAVPVLPRLTDRQRDHRRAGDRGPARRARRTGWSSGSGTASAPS